MRNRGILYLLFIVMTCCTNSNLTQNDIAVSIESVYSNQQLSGKEIGQWLILYKMQIKNNADTAMWIKANFLIPPDGENPNKNIFAILKKDTLELLNIHENIVINAHSFGIFRFHIEPEKLEKLYYSSYKNKFPIFQDYLSFVATSLKVVMVFNKNDTIILYPKKELKFEGDPNEIREWFY